VIENLRTDSQHKVLLPPRRGKSLETIDLITSSPSNYDTGTVLEYYNITVLYKMSS
jgi:hypothetical protein